MSRAVPPRAGMENSPILPLPATTRSPPTVQTPEPAPPSPAGASLTGVAFAPVIGSLQSLRSRTNAMCRLSGDQNAYSAPDVSGSGVDVNSLNARSQSRPAALYNNQRPSGAKSGGAVLTSRPSIIRSRL